LHLENGVLKFPKSTREGARNECREVVLLVLAETLQCLSHGLEFLVVGVIPGHDEVETRVAQGSKKTPEEAIVGH
jgi:hypothetical protein